MKATIEWPVQFGERLESEFRLLADRLLSERERRLKTYYPDEPASDCISTNYLWAREEILAWCLGQRRGTTSSAWPGTRGSSRRSAGSVRLTPQAWRRSGGAARAVPVPSSSSSRPHSQAGPASDRGRRQGQSTCPARPTRASWSPRLPGHQVSGPRPSTMRELAASRWSTWRTRSRSSS